MYTNRYLITGSLYSLSDHLFGLIQDNNIVIIESSDLLSLDSAKKLQHPLEKDHLTVLAILVVQAIRNLAKFGQSFLFGALLRLCTGVSFLMDFAVLPLVFAIFGWSSRISLLGTAPLLIFSLSISIIIKFKIDLVLHEMVKTIIACRIACILAFTQGSHFLCSPDCKEPGENPICMHEHLIACVVRCAIESGVIVLLLKCIPRREIASEELILCNYHILISCPQGQIKNEIEKLVLEGYPPSSPIFSLHLVNEGVVSK